jgi:hypothetical protein
MKSRGVVLFIVLLKSLHYPVDVPSLSRYNGSVKGVCMASQGVTGYNFPELRIRGDQTGGIPSDNKAARLAQQEIVLRLLASGIPIHEVAKQTKTSGITIAKWFRNPEMAARLKELNEMVWADLDSQLKVRATKTFERIQEASDEALDKVLELMHSADSEVVQMRCAQDILDRDPDTSKTKKIEKTTKNLTLSAEFLHLVETSEREAGTTIDG